MLRGTNIVALKLSTESKTALIAGDWVEACHSFKSSGTNKGEFEITDQMILDFDANFKSGKVRRWKDEKGACRLKLNFEHFSFSFAGWITDTKVTDKILSVGEKVKSLMIRATLTQDALTASKAEGKEYISIEYCASDPMYVDDQTGEKIANVLTGGALTDSPFVMELAPMRLSALEMLHSKEDLKNKKEAPPEMKHIVAMLGTVGVQLSAEASEAAIGDAILSLAKAKTDVEGRLSVKEAEVVQLTAKVKEAEKAVADMKEAEKKALSAAREKKIAELKEQAVTDLKLSKAEIEETDEAKQTLFVRLLSLQDLSLAELELSKLGKKVEPAGVAGGQSKTLSSDEAVVARAEELRTEAAKGGLKLSRVEALAKAKEEQAKASKGRA